MTTLPSFSAWYRYKHRNPYLANFLTPQNSFEAGTIVSHEWRCIVRSANEAWITVYLFFVKRTLWRGHHGQNIIAKWFFTFQGKFNAFVSHYLPDTSGRNSNLIKSHMFFISLAKSTIWHSQKWIFGHSNFCTAVGQGNIWNETHG